MQSAAITIAERGQRYAGQMAGSLRRVVPHVQGLERGEILDRIEKVAVRQMARRTFGVDDPGAKK
jgi:hypothetical protein